MASFHSFRGEASSSEINNETAGSGAISLYNRLQGLSMFSTTQGLSDADYSLNDVFSVLLKDLKELGNKVEAFQTEYLCTEEKSAGSRKYQQSSESRREHRYQDILSGKEDFVEGLTQAVAETNVSGDVPKTRIHCYQQLAAFLKERYNKTKEDIEMRMEELKGLEKEYSALELQAETFKKVQDGVEHSDDEDKTKLLIEEAETDLKTVVSALFSDNVHKEFGEAMHQLTEAFTNNLENEENQYVEFSPEVSINQAICALKKSFVVVEHPTNSAKIRLNLNE